MVDRISREHRSWNMSRIRGKNTAPERRVRSLLHSMGYRFRLHRKNLPGKPDIILPKHRSAIFVHGCFWHRHPGCKYAYIPKSRVGFWQRKFAGNQMRDRRVRQQLDELGWRVVIVWECEVNDQEKLKNRLNAALSQT